MRSGVRSPDGLLRGRAIGPNRAIQLSCLYRFPYLTDIKQAKCLSEKKVVSPPLLEIKRLDRRDVAFVGRPVCAADAIDGIANRYHHLGVARGRHGGPSAPLPESPRRPLGPPGVLPRIRRPPAPRRLRSVPALRCRVWVHQAFPGAQPPVRQMLESSRVALGTSRLSLSAAFVTTPRSAVDSVH